MFWVDTATGKQVKWSNIIRRFEKLWFIGKAPLIYMYTYWNHVSLVGIKPKAARIAAVFLIVDMEHKRAPIVKHLCWRTTTHILRKLVLRMAEGERLWRINERLWGQMDVESLWIHHTTVNVSNSTTDFHPTAELSEKSACCEFKWFLISCYGFKV